MFRHTLVRQRWTLLRRDIYCSSNNRLFSKSRVFGQFINMRDTSLQTAAAFYRC